MRLSGGTGALMDVRCDASLPDGGDSMKVLVTGAAGRVGANVVQRLVGNGAGVRAFVMPGDPQAAKLDTLQDVEVIAGDLCDYEVVAQAVRGVTHIVHLAAQMVRGNTEVGLFYEINALSTLRLIEAANEAGGLQRFVLASTDATFRPGDNPPVPLTEDAPQNPVNHYGTSKLLSEAIARNRALEYRIPLVIVRFATVLSPDEADGFFRLAFQRGWVATQHAAGKESTVWPLLARADLVDIIDQAAAGAPADAAVGFVGPDGPWRLSMIDVRDAARAVVRALAASGVAGRSFNVAAAEPVAYPDGAAVLAETFGVPQLTIELPVTWRLEFDISPAREGLGFAPEHDYRSTVASARTGGDFIPADEGDDGVYVKLSGRA
jgi:nucleoside-diphosphate-sugar epimerase